MLLFSFTLGGPGPYETIALGVVSILFALAVAGGAATAAKDSDKKEIRQEGQGGRQARQRPHPA
jgi:hypothetical protein